MNKADNRPEWWRQAVFRFKSHWPLKMVGTPIAIAAFMAVYFALLRYPQFPVTPVPWTPLDRLIEFRPWSIIPYASLWLYISLAPALLLLRRELAPYLSAVTLLSLSGFTIFLFWPTTVVQPEVDFNLYPAVALLKNAAPSGNACPSMHVAFAVLTALWLHRLFKRIDAPAALPAINIGWCLLILWSALSLKQHLALDLVAGTALALAIAVPHLYLLSQPDAPGEEAVSGAD